MYGGAYNSIALSLHQAQRYALDQDWIQQKNCTLLKSCTLTKNVKKEQIIVDCLWYIIDKLF